MGIQYDLFVQRQDPDLPSVYLMAGNPGICLLPLTLATALSESCLLAIIAKISYQIVWPMSLAPTNEAIKGETSGKPLFRRNIAQFWGPGQPVQGWFSPSEKA